VKRAEPTPQSPNGLNLDLRISIYATDGHSAFGYADDVGNIITCVDDLDLVAKFSQLVREVRKQQRRTSL
jgi:hypothetical protein